MNIDKPTKTCTLHADNQCTYLKTLQDKPYRGVNELKRHGGWLSFENVREAQEYYLAKFDNYSLIEHCMGDNMDVSRIESKHSNMDVESIDNISSFNSATSHYKSIMGFAPKKVEPNSLPKMARLFYYFIFTFLISGLLIFILLKLFF